MYFLWILINYSHLKQGIDFSLKDLQLHLGTCAISAYYH
jgi:hypothetical protein